MSINPVALIAGALSFSTALAWNRAVSDTLVSISGKTSVSTVSQAIVITLLVMFIVTVINLSVTYYNHYTNSSLKDSTIKAGGNADSRIGLWTKVTKK
jgi:hypothetical protein